MRSGDRLVNKIFVKLQIFCGTIDYRDVSPNITKYTEPLIPKPGHCIKFIKLHISLSIVHTAFMSNLRAVLHLIAKNLKQQCIDLFFVIIISKAEKRKVSKQRL